MIISWIARAGNAIDLGESQEDYHTISRSWFLKMIHFLDLNPYFMI